MPDKKVLRNEWQTLITNIPHPLSLTGFSKLSHNTSDRAEQIWL